MGNVESGNFGAVVHLLIMSLMGGGALWPRTEELRTLRFGVLVFSGGSMVRFTASMSFLAASALTLNAVMGWARRRSGMMRRPSRAHSLSVFGPNKLEGEKKGNKKNEIELYITGISTNQNKKAAAVKVRLLKRYEGQNGSWECQKYPLKLELSYDVFDLVNH